MIEEKRQEKSTFMLIFLSAAILLLMLPFFTTFNELLTRIFEKIHLYMAIQNYVVPYETRLVGAVLKPLGISYLAHFDGMTVNGRYLGLTWNCIGWQSLLLLGITLLTGLVGNFTFWSKVEAVAIGIIGTFLVNIFRMAFTAWLGAFYGEVFALVFHDYFATFVILAWLFVFWWFSYAYVLRQKRNIKYQNSNVK